MAEIAEEAQAAGLPLTEGMLDRLTGETKTMKEMGDDMEEMTEQEASKMTKQGHRRAGITTNKGRGTSKARRKMARQSRKINRK